VTPFQEFWYFFKKNRGAVAGLGVVLFFGVFAVIGPFLTLHDPGELFPEALKLPPFWSEGSKPGFLLGTDDVGRDILSRLIYGARVSMGIGFLVVFFSLSVGVVLGLIAGYFGGKIDAIIMRGVDIIMSLPSILLAIVVVAILGPSLFNAIVAVSIVAAPGFVRLVRASVLAEKTRQYVIASRSFGAGHVRMMFVNILPNCMAHVCVECVGYMCVCVYVVYGML